MNYNFFKQFSIVELVFQYFEITKNENYAQGYLRDKFLSVKSLLDIDKHLNFKAHCQIAL